MSSYKSKTQEELISKLYQEASIYDLQLRKIDHLSCLLNIKDNEKFLDKDSLSSFDNFFTMFDRFVERLKVMEPSFSVDSLMKKTEITKSVVPEERLIGDYIDSSFLLDMKSLDELISFKKDNKIIAKFWLLLTERDEQLTNSIGIPDCRLEEALEKLVDNHKKQIEEYKTKLMKADEEIGILKQNSYFVFDQRIRNLLKDGLSEIDQRSDAEMLARLLLKCNQFISTLEKSTEEEFAKLIEEVYL